MTLRLNGSTSGYTEIDAPAVAGSNTLVLPTGNGTSGQVLSTNGSGALSWIGAGKILQVAQATYSTSTNINTSTFTDTGLSITITPTSSSNKIMVMINQQVRNAASSPTVLGCRLRLLRGSTNIIDFSNSGGGFDSFEITADNGGNVRLAGYISTMYLDSPSTTSAVTYKTQASTSGGTHAFQNSGAPSLITVMEVAA
jgi:hypothetical protein